MHMTHHSTEKEIIYKGTFFFSPNMVTKPKIINITKVLPFRIITLQKGLKEGTEKRWHLLGCIWLAGSSH